MKCGWLLLIVVPAVALVWGALMYNRIINLRNLVSNAWSNVETELKRRYELIPNLVKTVQGYVAYERDLLLRLTEARSQAVASNGSPVAQAKDENALIQSLRQVFAVVEKYPDLKASQQFVELQHQLVNTEDRIQAARRFYNGNVRDYNNLVEMVPSNMIARGFGFRPAEYFEIEDTREREPVAVGSFR